MEIIAIKKGEKNTYQITLSTKEEITLFDDIIVKYELLPKKQLQERKLKEIQIENEKLESYYKALHYITIKQRTKKEIKKYLEKSQYPKEIIEKTIEKMELEGYINEERYITSFLNDAFRFSSDGPLRLRKKMMDLGLDAKKIEEGLQEMNSNEWLEKLEKLYQKKADSKHNDGLNKWKQKCAQYFYNLGYYSEWVEIASSKVKWQEDSKVIEREYNKIYQKCIRKYNGAELEFQIKRKLYEKGFSKEKIQEIIEENKESVNKSV